MVFAVVCREMQCRKGGIGIDAARGVFADRMILRRKVRRECTLTRKLRQCRWWKRQWKVKCRCFGSSLLQLVRILKHSQSSQVGNLDGTVLIGDLQSCVGRNLRGGNESFGRTRWIGGRHHMHRRKLTECWKQMMQRQWVKDSHGCHVETRWSEWWR